MRLRPVVRLVTDIAGLGILIYLLQAGQWVISAHPGAASDSSLNTINQWVFYSMLGVSVGFVISILMDAWKLIRGERKPAASAA